MTSGWQDKNFVFTCEMNITGTLPSDNFVKPKFTGLYLQVSGRKVCKFWLHPRFPRETAVGAKHAFCLEKNKNNMCEQSELERNLLFILWFYL
jgi:hypothetical protein